MRHGTSLPIDGLPRVTTRPELRRVMALEAAERFEPDPEPDVDPWRDMLRNAYGFDEPAPHQEDFWRWVRRIRPNKPQEPFIAVWPRGHGKSTSAETAVVDCGMRRVVHYALYVSETQSQADKHIAEIETLLASDYIERKDPALARRRVNKYGHSKGWRCDRLTTASGLVVDALGLDVHARGIKFEQQRPDLIIFDDVDSEDDSHDVTASKIKKITQKILPTGVHETKILGVQNLVKPGGIFHQIVNGDADFLLGSRVSGPIPAVDDLTYERVVNDNGTAEYRITGGVPTWDGMGLDACVAFMNRYGASAFLKECQHDVDDIGGGIFDGIPYRRLAMEDVFNETEIVRTVVAVDPAVTETDDSDCQAIQISMLGTNDMVYTVYSWEQIASPMAAMKRALLYAVRYGADRVIVETDQGGDTWRTNYRTAWQELIDSDDYPQITRRTRRPRFGDAKAGRTQQSKTARGQEMLHDYELGRVSHVTGTHLVLERALNRAFVRPPYDLADAAYWAWYDLRNSSGGKAIVLH